MATADPPAGLMDIASSLSQDEIPFKLRCAICNTLALNAFRLPCCDQAICETCQGSLPETCPVCAHTPISSDLCKPNKALRTTLKAFLRTEEKKREKERQSNTPAVTNGTTPADDTVAPSQETPVVSETPDVPTKTEPVETPPVADIPFEPPVADSQPQESIAADGPQTTQDVPANVPDQAENDGDIPIEETADSADPTDQRPHTAEGEEVEETPIAQSTEQDDPQDVPMGSIPPNGMGMGMAPGMFPNMGWNANADFNNPMSQLMGNGMFNFPNPMAMSGMAMNPMAANQSMFGGFGMNMNGMNNGMNMGMSYDAGQGMYGGWDGGGGAQNNMWNGGQDKFNPNAFANGMGPQYGPSSSGFGGYNANGLPQQYPQQDYSHTGSYYGPGMGRANLRGRGRGFGYMSGAGRGRGYPGNPADYSHHGPAFPHNSPAGGVSTDIASATQDEARPDESAPSAAAEEVNGDAQAQPSGDAQTNPSADDLGERTEGPAATDGQTEAEDASQLQGIPTIDSLDQANAAASGMMMPSGPLSMMGPIGPGYGRGGNFMRGGPYGGGRGPYMQGPNMHAMPRGPGVEGAPAAPRAMREGLPNTSVLRQRNFQGSGSARSSMPAVRPSEPPPSATTSVPPQEDQPLRSKSRSRSRAASTSRPRSRSRSPVPSQSDSRRAYRQRSPSVADSKNNHVPEDDRRSDRPRRPRRREDKYDDIPAIEDDRRTRSPSVESRRSSRRRDRDRERDRDRGDRRSGRRSHRSHRHPTASRNGDSDRLADIPEENGRSRTPAVGEPGDTASRAGRSTNGSSRREEERDRDRDARRRDRHRDRDRDRERDRDRDRYRERDRGDRDRDRDRDRKRSRRERSQSPPMDSDYSSRRRNKRTRDDAREDARPRDKPTSGEPEKDPHTLEREARNRERLQKEQQRREAALQGDGKSGRRRDSRALAGGRRVNYKYEDEENDSARAARVEKEREASRWA